MFTYLSFFASSLNVLLNFGGDNYGLGLLFYFFSFFFSDLIEAGQQLQVMGAAGRAGEWDW